MMRTGRPTAYRDEYVEQAYKLTLLMATDAELADFFGVAESTLYLWKNEHPDFSEAITRGGIQADAEVGEKLKHRAMGYSHEAVKIFLPSGASEPVYAPYTEHYPPDTQAASLWLRNRQPAKWRDKQDHEHTGKDGVPLIPAELDRGKVVLALWTLLLPEGDAPGNPDSGPLAIETTPTQPE